ncbi:MAG: Gfo/Idh/MocA family oxidoreductase [Planctomycetaceae bacterium]|nr:Gfo/Idh/MocA family oxidoreductase [Planctomycetaceae bacterium]
MAEKKCRWGILGAATIAQKNWKAIHNSGNAVVTAVASRSPEKANAFIQARQLECPFAERPVACSYDELLQRNDVEAVYIPLPTGLRKEWVIKAADAGKHVMCEKPCAPSAADLREMISACERNGVQFMDGVMYMHSDRMPAVRQTIDDGTSIGEMKRIHSQFSFRAPEEFIRENIRVSSALEPQGCVGDLGWYTIRFSLWAMNYRMPIQVIGRKLSQYGRADSPSDVPMEFSGELLFDGGVSAGFYVSFLTEHQQWVNISGSKGFLQVSDFVLPNYGSEVVFDVVRNVFAVDGCQFHMRNSTQRIATEEYSDGQPNAQETKLFRTFSELALGQTPDPHWPEISLKTQLVMDACLKSAELGGKPVSPDA